MKEYTIEIRRRTGNTEVKGTLDYLKQYFGYTLKVGESWQNEPGNYRINRNPKSGKALVDYLNKAEHNRARNGCASTYYTLIEG